MNRLAKILESSIGKKQIVAVTGLLLIGFLIGHLAGNLLIFLGPTWYNGYAERLGRLRPSLYLVEIALLFIFVIHIYVTALVVIENIKARGGRYSVYKAVGKRSLATRIMPYTGTYILIFVVWHLLDFTFVDHNGPLSIMPNGEHLGLYAIVYNSFMDPIHTIGYILAMGAIGFHLTHGIQSFFQTFGFNNRPQIALMKSLSGLIGITIAVLFSSIPIYIYFDSLKFHHGV